RDRHRRQPDRDGVHRPRLPDDLPDRRGATADVERELHHRPGRDRELVRRRPGHGWRRVGLHQQQQPEPLHRRHNGIHPVGSGVAPGYREVSSARMSRLGKVAGWSPLAGLAAAVAAAIPMLAWAVALAARRPTLYFDGDAALDEISLVNSTHLAQLVGNYSRFGWWHPGPAWFYTMDILYVPLGRESWAFSVAVAVFQAVLALLILYICWRIAGLPLVAVGSALLLGYYALVGDALFRSIWPPYLVILPMLLLILLAALGISGSTPALAAALVVGSFEIQTHVGTAPATVAVVGGAFVLRVVLDRLAARRTGWGPRPDGRWKWPLSAAGAVLTVVMWIPPLVDEVTGNPGNLTALFRFFTHNGPSRG